MSTAPVLSHREMAPAPLGRIPSWSRMQCWRIDGSARQIVFEGLWSRRGADKREELVWAKIVYDKRTRDFVAAIEDQRQLPPAEGLVRLAATDKRHLAQAIRRDIERRRPDARRPVMLMRQIFPDAADRFEHFAQLLEEVAALED